MKLLLVRHGEIATSSPQDPDPPLSERGRSQAYLLGQWLTEHYQIQAFYTSPLRRARQTAEIVSENIIVPFTVEEDLREADFYLPNSIPTFSTPGAFLINGPVAPQAMSSEYQKLSKRALRITRKILDKHQGEAVLLIAHNGIIATMMRNFLGNHALRFPMEFTGVHQFPWQNGMWSIDFLNRHEHLLLGQE